MQQYVIVKKNKKYRLIDLSSEKTQSIYFRTINGRLYKRVSHDKANLDDYNLPNNAGSKIHRVVKKVFVGKIINQSKDIEAIAIEYCNLIKQEEKYDKK